MRASLAVCFVYVVVCATHGHCLVVPDVLLRGVNPGQSAGSVGFDRVPFPVPGHLQLSLQSWNATSRLTGRHFVAHMATLADPAYFSFEVLADGCSRHTITSKTAQAFNCHYATNAGFFGYPTGGCIGDLVINSTAKQLSASNTAFFGTTRNATWTGFAPEDTIKQAGFSQLVSGVGWLVREGRSYVDHSPDLNPTASFTLEKAPRTGVAACKNGSIVILQVDGQEDIHAGADLYEFADLFVQVGALTAVNLDGGGSSVSVLNGEVISRPTCVDTSKVCERDVTSITCVRQFPQEADAQVGAFASPAL